MKKNQEKTEDEEKIKKEKFKKGTQTRVLILFLNFQQPLFQKTCVVLKHLYGSETNT